MSEEKPQDQKEELQDEKENEEKSEQADDEPKEGEEGSEKEGEEDSGEMEVVLEDREGESPKKGKRSVRNRVNQLNERNRQTQSERDDVSGKLAIAEEKLKLYEMDRQQRLAGDQGTKEPNPDNFDAGTLDPQYVDQKRKYDDFRMDQIVEEKVGKATKAFRETAKASNEEKELRTRSEQHYERADNFKSNNFIEMEDKVIAIMGKPAVDQIILNYDTSEKLIYLLGNKPEYAEEVRDLFKDDRGIAAVKRLTELNERLKVVPKNKITPDPDKELEGGAATNTDHLSRKLDKLREKAAGGSSKDFGVLMDFKKEHKERLQKAGLA